MHKHTPTKQGDLDAPGVVKQVAREVSNWAEGHAAAGCSDGVGRAGWGPPVWAAGSTGLGLDWAMVAGQHGTSEASGRHCIQVLHKLSTAWHDMTRHGIQ